MTSAVIATKRSGLLVALVVAFALGIVLTLATQHLGAPSASVVSQFSGTVAKVKPDLSSVCISVNGDTSDLKCGRAFTDPPALREGEKVTVWVETVKDDKGEHEVYLVVHNPLTN